MPRGLKALALAAALLSALAPVASAAGAPRAGLSITIDGNSKPLFFDEDRLDREEHFPLSEFTTRGGPGGGDGTVTQPGVAVDTVLKRIGLAPDHVQTFQVARLQAPFGFVSVAPDKLAGPYPGDPKGDRPALFITYNAYADFIRPLDAAIPDDRNFDDYVFHTTSQQEPLDVRVRMDGDTRQVRASVSPDPPVPGQAAQFSVTDPVGTGWTYNWDWDDGTSDSTTTASMPHTYTRSGLYQPSVTVFNGGSSGVFVFDSLQVGDPADPTPTPTPTATPAATASPSGTPTGPGKSGAGAGKKGKSGGGEGTDKDRATGPARSKGKSDRTTTGTKQATATATATATASEPGSGSTDGGTGLSDGESAAASTPGPSTSDGTATATATPAPTSAPTVAPAPKGVPVEGILLASSGEVADVIASARSAAAQSQQQDRSQSRRGGGDSAPIAGWVGGGFGLFGLLLLGALREGGFRR